MNTGSDREVEKAKKYCLRLLSLRPRTEKEIETRLQDKGYGEGTRRRVLDLLKKDGLIDDVKFAGDWIDSRLRSNPRGRRALEVELKRKGVPGKIIEKVLAGKAAELDERKIAGDLIRKKLAKADLGSDRNLKGRLFQFLLRKGFDGEVAEEAIKEKLGD